VDAIEALQARRGGGTNAVGENVEIS
jgi:hypothetical protein